MLVAHGARTTTDGGCFLLQVEGINVRTILSDFTPPDKLTLLITDIGVLTPSAVSDELIKLYY